MHGSIGIIIEVDDRYYNNQFRFAIANYYVLVLF